MRALTRLLAVAAVLVVAASCTNTRSDTQPTPVPDVKIGLLAPLSGASGAAGADALHGAQLAAALVNGDEGSVRLPGVGTSGLSRLGGAKITIVAKDTKSAPERGVTEAVGLVNQARVAGLVGAYDTDVTAAASQRSDRLRVPFVNGDTSAGYLTERGLDWFFRTGPTDRMFGESFFSALGQQQGKAAKTQPPDVAILFADDTLGNGIATLTEELADQGGYNVVAQELGRPGRHFAPGGADLTPAIVEVRASQPDAVFLIASASADASKALKAFGQLGYRPPRLLTFGSGPFEPSVLEAAGQDGEGVLYSAAWSRETAERNPAARPVVDLYQARFDTPMTEVAAGSFTAVLTLAAAIDLAGSVDPERVRGALISLDTPGRDTIMPWNGVRFDATHQNTRASGVVEQRVQDVFRVIFPRELA